MKVGKASGSRTCVNSNRGSPPSPAELPFVDSSCNLFRIVANSELTSGLPVRRSEPGSAYRSRHKKSAERPPAPDFLS
jgi:hypothetical protein